MYQYTLIQPDGNTRQGTPYASVAEVLRSVVDTLLDGGVEPRLARRFAIHLTRQPLGCKVEHKPTRWTFRIDEVPADPHPPEADHGT